MALMITGHREIPHEKNNLIKGRLREEMKKAADMGCTRMISGFAEGVDLIFAEIAVELKKAYPQITIEAAIPYSGRMKTKNPDFHRLLKECEKITILSETYYKSCFLDRNIYDAQH